MKFKGSNQLSLEIRKDSKPEVNDPQAAVWAVQS
jgi:hypothetical protein